MKLTVTGLNHTTAPVEIREKFDFTEGEIREGLERLKRIEGVSECLILSTCNRVEVIADVKSEESLDRIVGFLATFHGMEKESISPYLYYYLERDAVKHIFRVSSSLDSMVVGETQITGQVKSAYLLSREALAARGFLTRTYDKAFAVAKRVRTETGIGDRAVSVGYAAVELAKKIFSRPGEHSVFIIGAGEMSESVAENLLSSGVSKLYFTNRTAEKAEKLAEKFGGTAVPYESMEDYLTRTDIVITSTSADRCILDRGKMEGLMRERRNRHLFLIDIAVPRDIDPAVNGIDNIFLYDIDDLKDIVEENLRWRKDEALKGEKIVDEEVLGFLKYLNGLEVDPVIKVLRGKIENLRKSEIERCKKYLGNCSPEQIEAVDKMTRAFMNKILHDPVREMKTAANNGRIQETVETVRKIFKLQIEEDDET